MRCSAFFIDYHHFGYASYGVDYFVLLVELYAVLAVVAEFHRLADVEMSGVGSRLAEEHFYECRFAHAVVAHDAHFFISCERVFEAVEYHLVVVCLCHIHSVKDFGADVG